MKVWKAAALAAGAVAYGRAILRRNGALVPPPVRDTSGVPFPCTEFRHSDGERVGLVDAGAGIPILWIPGADGIKETWRYQLPAFASRYRVVAADLRRTIRPQHTFDRLVDDAVEIVDGLGLGRVVLVGQSLGGAIAMRFAHRFPERLRGLVLCNTLARYTREHAGWNRTSLVPLAIGTTRYLPTALSVATARLWSRLGVWIYDDSPGRDRVVDYALWTGPRTVPASIAAARVALFKGEDLRPSLSHISAPTLVVKGTNDHYTPAAWSVEIAARIPGARYAPMHGTGHCSHISDPGRFNALLAAWLEEALCTVREETRGP